MAGGERARDEGFRTLATEVRAELRDRRSRFLAVAVPVADRAAADTFLDAQRTAHRDATHVVPAFVLHDGTAYAGDAGEPAGSAGAPLLAAIRGAGLRDVAAVVARWYGGTKLGVGGLVRAYGGALALALRDAPTRAAVPAVRLEVRYAYALTAAVVRTLGAHGAMAIEHDHAEVPIVRFAVPASREAALHVALRDGTRGEAVARPLGRSVLYAP